MSIKQLVGIVFVVLLVSCQGRNVNGNDIKVRKGEELLGDVKLFSSFSIVLPIKFIVTSIEEKEVKRVVLQSERVTIYIDKLEFEKKSFAPALEYSRSFYSGSGETKKRNGIEYLGRFSHGIEKDNNNFGLQASIYKVNQCLSVEFSYPNEVDTELVREIWLSVH